METWKQIRGFENYYEVSDQGRVRSLPRDRNHYKAFDGNAYHDGRVLRPRSRRHGYLCVKLYKPGGAKDFFISRLVAAAFCNKAASDTEVNHKNRIKTDNRAENLEWTTRRGNMVHALGKTVYQFKDGALCGVFDSSQEAARQTSLSPVAINRCATGSRKTYKGYQWLSE